MPPEKHARLSASGAKLWSTCTAAPTFTRDMPDKAGIDAEIGTLAHAVCELKLRHELLGMDKAEYTSRMRVIQSDALYDPEMDTTSDQYVSYIRDIDMAFDYPPTIAVEVRVDFGDYVPEGFGTCDCCIIGGDTLHIVDYKHGRGVAVDAENNPQLRLYALGALNRYAPIYGDGIRRVCMSIVQPRLSIIAKAEMAVDALREWGETLKPIARVAFDGPGEFVPGEHCRFCRGRAVCRARAEKHTALEDFKGIKPDALSDAEIGDLLSRGKHLVKWYKDLEEYATGRLLDGKPVEGWKLVAGRSVRTWTDQDAALAAIRMKNYLDEALVYDRVPKSLSSIEKLMGKASFAEKMGDYVIKPPGKPALVPASDKREAYNPAAADFAGAI